MFPHLPAPIKQFDHYIIFFLQLLVFHRAPSRVADRGKLTRYGGYQENKITRGGPKLALLPGSLILAYQGLEEENIDQESPGPPGWGLMLIDKKEIAKRPIGNTLDRYKSYLLVFICIRCCYFRI
jgi:hypothetical protein